MAHPPRAVDLRFFEPVPAPRKAGRPIPRSPLSKIENGATYVGLEIIDKLAQVLEVEPAELLKR